MKHSKYYFEIGNDEYCYSLNFFQESLSWNSEILLRLAKREARDYQGVWCAWEGESFERRNNDCGLSCNGYKPRNGKGGICKHQTTCYRPVGQILSLTKNGLAIKEKK